MSFYDDTILLFAMLEQAPVLIKRLNLGNGNIKTFEDGFISLKKSYKLFFFYSYDNAAAATTYVR